jgi:hypothetical protein
MACPRRCAGSRGDLEGLVFVKVLVQERKQVAAGDRRGGSVLRPLVEYCKIRGKENTCMSARSRGF